MITTANAADYEKVVSIYDNALASGFENWSWTDTDLQSSEKVNNGSYAIYGKLKSFEAIFLGRLDALDLPVEGRLEFAIYSNSDTKIVVQTRTAGGGDGPPVAIELPANQWQDYTIPLADLGVTSNLTGVWWQQFSESDSGGVYLDDIRIAGLDKPEPDTPVTLTVTTEKHSIERQIVDPANGKIYNTVVSFPKPISEDIYGINFAPNSLREELDVPVSRWGGNATERYNYQTSSSNQARDWYFANNPLEPGADSIFEQENQLDGTDSMLTVPLLGWVSSNRRGTCSYPVNLQGAQDDSIFHWIDASNECGNGYKSGEFIGSVDPTRTSIAADEKFVANWVRNLVSVHGPASEGGVEYYALGNEPGLWHSTHGDLQATPMSRTSIIERNIRYAKSIKSVDPTAEILGPVLWGASSYYVSSDEKLDGRRPGDVDYFLQDYLTAMETADRASGERLLDRLAVNFYDQRVYDGGTDKLRLESTRHLWDSGYAPADWWVTRDFLYGNGSAVIPRLRSAVNEFYPGTKLALTEYHFGGAATGVGGLAQIDALGIFGREGLDMATLWEPYADYVTTPEAMFSDMPLFWAFRMYRNFDGRGGKFGSISLFAASSDEGRVSIYAAMRGRKGAITLIVVNKTDTPVPLLLKGITGQATGFRYLASKPNAISRLGKIAIDGTAELPGYSATLIMVSN